MLVIRAARTCLDALALTPDPDPPRGTNALGDWYATMVRGNHRELVIFVNAKTRLVVLCALADPRVLVSDLRRRLSNLLVGAGLSREAIDRELGAFGEVTFAQCATKSAVVALNRLADDAARSLHFDDDGRPTDRTDFERRTASSLHPCPRNDRMPEEIIREVLQPETTEPGVFYESVIARNATCERCGAVVPHFQAVDFRSPHDYQVLCSVCSNAEVIRGAGVEFEDARFDPVSVPDLDGVEHEFAFTTRHLGDRVVIAAQEVRRGRKGERDFEIVSQDPEADVLELFARLVQKIRRALGRRHVVIGPEGLEITDGHVVRARIGTWVSDDDRLEPRLVIDGKDVNWADFGEALAQYEGWELKLEMHGKEEER
jgi:hypothetical protein